MISPYVIVYGTNYQKNSIILLKCEDDDLPSFGVVEELYILNKEIYLVHHIRETVQFEENLNAYEVRKTFPLQ